VKRPNRAIADFKLIWMATGCPRSLETGLTGPSDEPMDLKSYTSSYTLSAGEGKNLNDYG